MSYLETGFLIGLALMFLSLAVIALAVIFYLLEVATRPDYRMIVRPGIYTEVGG